MSTYAVSELSESDDFSCKPVSSTNLRGAAALLRELSVRCTPVGWSSLRVAKIVDPFLVVPVIEVLREKPLSQDTS